MHNNDIEHDGADKMSYVFDYCYEDKKGVSFVYVVQCRRKVKKIGGVFKHVTLLIFKQIFVIKVTRFKEDYDKFSKVLLQNKGVQKLM